MNWLEWFGCVFVIQIIAAAFLAVYIIARLWWTRDADTAND